MAVGGVQLELVVADRAAAGDGQRLDRAERERTGALDQQVLVELAQLALGFAGRCPQPLGGALGAAERDAGKGEPPEQVVPVAVRGQQPAGPGKWACSSSAGSVSSSSGSTGESITKVSSLAPRPARGRSRS